MLGILGAVAAAGVLVTGPVRADDPSDQQAFVDRINDIRTTHGLKPVVVDSRLTLLARTWAVQMAASGVLAHNPKLAAQGPPRWTVLGENVGVSAHDVGVLHR